MSDSEIDQETDAEEKTETEEETDAEEEIVIEQETEESGGLIARLKQVLARR